MTAISQKFSLKIEDRLNTTYFLKDDFSIDSEIDFSSNVIVTIQYNYIPNYIFKGTVLKKGNEFCADYTPGAILTTESREGINEYNFFSALQNWLDNIINEMEASPLVRKINKHEEILKVFQDKINSMDNGDEFFSYNEGEDLKKRLEELEEAFKQKLENDLKNTKEYDTEIKSLHKEIEILTTQLEALSKRNWFLSLSARIYNWYKRNPAVVRQLAGFTRELLPKEAKEMVSHEALDQLLLPSENANDQNS